MSVLATLGTLCPVEWNRSPPPAETAMTGTFVWLVLAATVAFVARFAHDSGAARVAPAPAFSGWRRAVHTGVLLTIGWAGLLAYAETWRGHGTELTVVIGATAMALAAVAIRRPARRTVRWVSWLMLSLVFFCVIDLQPSTSPYPAERTHSQGLAREALWIVMIAAPVLVGMVEALLAVERRRWIQGPACLAAMTARNVPGRRPR